MSIYVLKVESEHDGERLDVYLSKALTDAPSRSFIQKILEAGSVQVNQKQLKSHYKVHQGDSIVVEMEQKVLDPYPLSPENIPLDIFYEDEFLMVVNKPSGMLVHPAQKHNSGTLVNALLFHYQRLSNCNTDLRPGIVHRLDKETSGLIIAVKDNKTHMQLARQFQEHKVKKQYLALVEGEVAFDEGIIDVPLGRHSLYHDLRAVQYDDAAKSAVTFYKVIKRHKGVTLIYLFPKSGRTHQLRVHMSHVHHPILGDAKYGNKGNFPRLALHAKAIGFEHPRWKSWLELSCRPPQEFLEKVEI